MIVSELAAFFACFGFSVRPDTDWRPFRGSPRLSPFDSWDRLQPDRDPELNGRKLCDGWITPRNLGATPSEPKFVSTETSECSVHFPGWVSGTGAVARFENLPAFSRSCNSLCFLSALLQYYSVSQNAKHTRLREDV